MVITIDGPAASGKSTVAAKLATRLGFIHLNSGLLYRAVALTARTAGLRLDDDAAVSNLAKSLHFEFQLKPDGGQTTFLVDNVEYGAALAEESVSKLASEVALLPSLRKFLLEVQRRVAEKSVVVEGRDSGSVVFPDAEKKFFLDAGLDVRARRRLEEIIARNIISEQKVDWKALGWEDEHAAFEELRRQVEQRDLQDSTRKIAPQKIPTGAKVIDTSALSTEQVVELLIREVSLQ